MLSTLLVIGGVLVGLFVLLAVIVCLSARPEPSRPSGPTGCPVVPRHRPWTADVGRSHPDAWSPLSTTSEIPAVR